MLLHSWSRRAGGTNGVKPLDAGVQHCKAGTAATTCNGHEANISRHKQTQNTPKHNNNSNQQVRLTASSTSGGPQDSKFQQVAAKCSHTQLRKKDWLCCLISGHTHKCALTQTRAHRHTQARPAVLIPHSPAFPATYVDARQHIFLPCADSHKLQCLCPEGRRGRRHSTQQ